MNNQAAQTMPERTYMTRDEALKIARACAYAKCHTHGYLPRTAQEAADWQPHEWALDAIRWNALSQPAGVHDGWKLVPVEPTEVQCLAGADAIERAPQQALYREESAMVYDAMRAALEAALAAMLEPVAVITDFDRDRLNDYPRNDGVVYTLDLAADGYTTLYRIKP